jgi:hypothetical protein
VYATEVGAESYHARDMIISIDGDFDVEHAGFRRMADELSSRRFVVFNLFKSPANSTRCELFCEATTCPTSASVIRGCTS